MLLVLDARSYTLDPVRLFSLGAGPAVCGLRSRWRLFPRKSQVRTRRRVVPSPFLPRLLYMFYLALHRPLTLEPQPISSLNLTRTKGRRRWDKGIASWVL